MVQQPIAEGAWATGVCATWLFGLFVFVRYRRRTQASMEWETFKSDLPPWVDSIERLVWLAISLVLSQALLLGLIHAHSLLHPGQDGGDLAKVMIVLSSFIVAIVPAALAANAISWIVPQLRRANLSAMKLSYGISFWSANRGLLLAGAVIIPIAAVQATIGVIEPWAGR